MPAPIVPEKRFYRRFKLREGAVAGKLDRVHAAEVIDLSVGGVALRSERDLPIGSECTMRFELPDAGIDVQGVVVRSHVAGVGEAGRSGRMPLYSLAMRFREGLEDQIADFITGAIVA